MSGADRYYDWLAGCFGNVQEAPASFHLSQFSELELQARWFCGEFGRSFRTLSGDAVEIVQFGEWNREAGPDFRSAAVSINGARPVRGAIELDADVRDWERHGHAVNPAYNNVALHVFWNVGKSELFTQTLSGRAVPQVLLNARVDGTAPNRVPLVRCGRCFEMLAAMPEGKVADLLAAAAHYRMRRKARRIGAAAEIHGEHEAPYQFVAEALGYKGNKVPFLLLAQRFPVRNLRKWRDEAESILFGISGFLTEMDLQRVPGDTKEYLRQLWAGWWARRAEFANLVLPVRMWKCGGVRPMNHPQRRIGALAEIARRWPKLREVLGSANPQVIARFFSTLSHDYWDYHYTLTSGAARTRMALVGPERVNGIVMNVVLPLALRDCPSQFEKLQQLAAPDYNLRVKNAALRLFGKEAKRVALLRTSVNQQGILQIYDDFCSHDFTDCIACRFPEQIAQWR